MTTTYKLLTTNKRTKDGRKLAELVALGGKGLVNRYEAEGLAITVGTDIGQLALSGQHVPKFLIDARHELAQERLAMAEDEVTVARANLKRCPPSRGSKR